jgi:hypothetical protein
MGWSFRLDAMRDDEPCDDRDRRATGGGGSPKHSILEVGTKVQGMFHGIPFEGEVVQGRYHRVDLKQYKYKVSLANPITVFGAKPMRVTIAVGGSSKDEGRRNLPRCACQGKSEKGYGVVNPFR